MAERKYTANRAEKVARITGQAWEFHLNDGAPYHCVTNVTPASVQARVTSAARAIQGLAVPSGYSPPEWVLREIIDPSDHERLHDEFLSVDPALMIVVGDEEAGEIVRDFLSYLGGGLPFELSAPSAGSPSTTGLSSVPSTPLTAPLTP